MSAQGQTEYIGVGSCACPCHSTEDKDAVRRPNMLALLHQLLHEKRWEEVQDTIRRDPRVSMRVDDSMEEDRRFAMAGLSAAFVEEALTLRNNADASASEEQESNTSSSRPTEDVMPPSAPELPLRYWVNNDLSQVQAHSHAQIRQKRTLLHSLCRMSLPSTELMGAVKTAGMLIDASHNLRRPGDGIPKPCNNCECFVVQVARLRTLAHRRTRNRSVARSRHSLLHCLFPHELHPFLLFLRQFPLCRRRCAGLRQRERRHC